MDSRLATNTARTEVRLNQGMMMHQVGLLWDQCLATVATYDITKRFRMVSAIQKQTCCTYFGLLAVYVGPCFTNFGSMFGPNGIQDVGQLENKFGTTWSTLRLSKSKNNAIVFLA